MARTVDTEAHAVRREAFVDAAQRLMQAKGYEQMSVQDVLDEVGRVARRLLPLLRLQDGAARGGRDAHRRHGAGLGDAAGGGSGARRPGQARGPLRRHRPVEAGAHRAHAGADARLALRREHPHARQDVAAPDAAARAAARARSCGRATTRASSPSALPTTRRACWSRCCTGSTTSRCARSSSATRAASRSPTWRPCSPRTSRRWSASSASPAGTLTLVDRGVLREWYA